MRDNAYIKLAFFSHNHSQQSTTIAKRIDFYSSAFDLTTATPAHKQILFGQSTTVCLFGVIIGGEIKIQIHK